MKNNKKIIVLVISFLMIIVSFSILNNQNVNEKINHTTKLIPYTSLQGTVYLNNQSHLFTNTFGQQDYYSWATPAASSNSISGEYLIYFHNKLTVISFGNNGHSATFVVGYGVANKTSFLIYANNGKLVGFHEGYLTYAYEMPDLFRYSNYSNAFYSYGRPSSTDSVLQLWELGLYNKTVRYANTTIPISTVSGNSNQQYGQLLNWNTFMWLMGTNGTAVIVNITSNTWTYYPNIFIFGESNQQYFIHRTNTMYMVEGDMVNEGDNVTVVKYYPNNNSLERIQEYTYTSGLNMNAITGGIYNYTTNQLAVSQEYQNNGEGWFIFNLTTNGSMASSYYYTSVPYYNVSSSSISNGIRWQNNYNNEVFNSSFIEQRVFTTTAFADNSPNITELFNPFNKNILNFNINPLFPQDYSFASTYHPNIWTQSFFSGMIMNNNGAYAFLSLTGTNFTSTNTYNIYPNPLIIYYTNNSLVYNQHYTLSIKENGLPSGTSFTYDLNGTSHTVNTTEQNYSEPNGNYSLSVTNVNGYNVNYPTTIKVNGSNVIAYINFTKIPTYTLTLKENGLPSGTSFTYTFNGNSYTLTNNSYKYALSNGTYSLSVTNVNGYNVVYPSSIKIAGANQTDYINFSLIPTYTLFVKETGLVNGTTYHIFVGSTEYSSSTPYNNVTGLTNGTYTFKVDTISGYLLSSYPTSFTINGANDTIDITFTKNASTYNVNIIENGLVNPDNIKWSVVFNGITYISANSNSITIGGILNGSYSFKVNSIAGYVIDKYNTTLVIKGNTTYNIYFNETFLFVLHGLNINVFWAITFNSSSIDESNNYINLSLVNQTFSLSIIVPTGYSVSLYPKTVTINGKNVYLNVTFSKITITAGHYIVTLYIEGYNGNWSISINNQQYYSMHSEMNITLTNGTYIPIVALPSNYQLQPLQPLVVNGNNTVYVIYAKAYFNWVYYEPYIAIILLVLAVLIIPAVVRRS